MTTSQNDQTQVTASISGRRLGNYLAKTLLSIVGTSLISIYLALPNKGYLVDINNDGRLDYVSQTNFTAHAGSLLRSSGLCEGLYPSVRINTDSGLIDVNKTDMDYKIINRINNSARDLMNN